MRRSWLFPIVAALVYVVILNHGWIGLVLSGHDVPPAMLKIERGSSDQSLYFSYINTVSQGFTLAGNAVLREHRGDVGNVIFGAVFQGVLKRVTGWSSTTVVMIGDMVFPFLAFLMLWLTLSMMPGRFERLATTVLAMNVVGLSWLRQVSPQVTLLFFFVYLAVFFRSAESSRMKRVLRGLLAGLLLFIQIHYALFALCIEGLDALRLVSKHRRAWKKVLAELLWTVVPALILIGMRVFIAHAADPLALADTQRRFGVLRSWLPAAPRLQLELLFVALMTIPIFLRHRRLALRSDTASRCIILLVAGFIILNQSLLHGYDGIILVYYPFPIRVVLWLCIGIAAHALLFHHMFWRRAVFGMAMIASVAVFAYTAVQSYRFFADQAMYYDGIDAPQVLSYLRQQRSDLVVAAPFVIADIVPALTDHSVLFNHNARFGVVTDNELAERYLLYKALFPEHHPTIDDTSFGVVFGQYAGNLSARMRLQCRVLSLWTKSTADCPAKIQDSIFHQDILRMLQTSQIDPPTVMRQFAVDLLIRSQTGAGIIPPQCAPARTIGPWAVYGCKR